MKHLAVSTFALALWVCLFAVMPAAAGDGFAGAIVAEVERDRVEEIAGDARQRDEHDAPAGEQGDLRGLGRRQ